MLQCLTTHDTLIEVLEYRFGGGSSDQMCVAYSLRAKCTTPFTRTIYFTSTSLSISVLFPSKHAERSLKSLEQFCDVNITKYSGVAQDSSLVSCDYYILRETPIWSLPSDCTTTARIDYTASLSVENLRSKEKAYQREEVPFHREHQTVASNQLTSCQIFEGEQLDELIALKQQNKDLESKLIRMQVSMKACSQSD